MEVIKRISQGRLSEMAGPLTIEIDEAVRHLGYGRASQKIVAAMPTESRAWLDSYVEGVNYYKQTISELPHEYEVLGLDPKEPWTAEDTITAGRLSGTDVNWMTWFGLLQYYGSPDYEDFYQDLVTFGTTGMVSIDPDRSRNVALIRNQSSPSLKTIETIMKTLSKAGSNAAAISGDLTKSGAPMVANDPHLGLIVPNFWVMAGLKSPSYHAVGMMVPGIPVFGFGRTPDFSWGGTNMRALNSDLVDVTELPEEDFIEETHLIKVRYWPDHVFKARVAKGFGPVISDAPVFPAPDGKDLALKWIGHEVTDEITALLRASKAKDFQNFKTAMKDFAIPAQNFIYAGKDGEIGLLLATQIPKRDKSHVKSIIQNPEDVSRYWQEILNATTLPYEVNPASGYLASTNNEPVDTSGLDYPVGYFFAPDERMRRFSQLLANGAHDVETLSILQRDTKSLLSGEIVQAMQQAYPSLPEKLKKWDGRYDADSHEALYFEALVEELAPKIFRLAGVENLYEAVGRRPQMRAFLLSFLEAIPAETLTPLFEESIIVAQKNSHDAVWGDRHKLKAGHFLSNIPLWGDLFYAGKKLPTGGSLETVFKSAHAPTHEEHRATYGSQSRHISDMAEDDANYFVLIGGNDGWIGSDQSLNQIPLWQTGEYVQIPLGLANVSKTFTSKTTLRN